MSGSARNRPGDYARARDGNRADRNNAPAVITTGTEVVKPAPNDWSTPVAIAAWELAADDEVAQERWGTGDWLQWYITCEVLESWFTPNRDGSARKIGPDSLRVILQAFQDLALTTTSKHKVLGWFVERRPNPDKPESLALLDELDMRQEVEAQ